MLHKYITWYKTLIIFNIKQFINSYSGNKFILLELIFIVLVTVHGIFPKIYAVTWRHSTVTSSSHPSTYSLFCNSTLPAISFSLWLKIHLYLCPTCFPHPWWGFWTPSFLFVCLFFCLFVCLFFAIYCRNGCNQHWCIRISPGHQA